MIIHCLINLSPHHIHLPFLYGASSYTFVLIENSLHGILEKNKRAMKCDFSGGGKMRFDFLLLPTFLFNELCQNLPELQTNLKEGRMT